jgi:hypothetical protein
MGFGVPLEEPAGLELGLGFWMMGCLSGYPLGLGFRVQDKYPRIDFPLPITGAPTWRSFCVRSGRRARPLQPSET